MDNLELKTARKLFALSEKEAAEHIGKMSERSWKYLENGSKPIPQDIVDTINTLLQRRRDVLETVQQQMLRADADFKKMAVVYYPSPEFCKNILDWRFSQSLAQTLAHDYGAKLVEFNDKQYCSWLVENGMVDTPQKRSQWAAEMATS